MINDPNSAIASQLTITIDGQQTTFTEGETNVNILTGSGYDPVTQTAEL